MIKGLLGEGKAQCNKENGVRSSTSRLWICSLEHSQSRLVCTKGVLADRDWSWCLYVFHGFLHRAWWCSHSESSTCFWPEQPDTDRTSNKHFPLGWLTRDDQKLSWTWHTSPWMDDKISDLDYGLLIRSCAYRLLVGDFFKNIFPIGIPHFYICEEGFIW